MKNKIHIDNEHIIADIRTKKMDDAFIIATAIAKVCEILEERDKNE